MTESKMTKKGFFITFEGIEGTGKSTAIKFVQRWLSEQNVSFVATREPGGTVIANAIRHLLLADYPEKIAADTELLLMFASRAQNIAQVIKPALAEGKWVLCDRFTDASYAYQGGGRGINAERIAVLENWVHADLQPHLTLLLDAPMAVGLSRIAGRTKDRIEKEQGEFFERVRDAYLQLAKKYPQRFKIIDASADIDSVQEQLVNALIPLVY